jgi:hypothetical protein
MVQGNCASELVINHIILRYNNLHGVTVTEQCLVQCNSWSPSITSHQTRPPITKISRSQLKLASRIHNGPWGQEILLKLVGKPHVIKIPSQVRREKRRAHER